MRRANGKQEIGRNRVKQCSHNQVHRSPNELNRDQLPVVELRRATRFIASKYGTRYGFDADDLLQEALVAAWHEPSPLVSFKVRAGTRRATKLATEHRRATGHPGGTRSGATPPRTAIIGAPLDHDGAVTDRYVTVDPALRAAVSALNQRDQRVVYALAFDLSPSESASYVGVTPGYFRQLRSSVLSTLRSNLVGAQ